MENTMNNNNETKWLDARNSFVCITVKEKKISLKKYIEKCEKYEINEFKKCKKYEINELLKSTIYN